MQGQKLVKLVDTGLQRDSMKFEHVIRGVETIDIRGDTEAEVSGIACDSRKVKTGSVFVAVRGFNSDGNAFIPEAVKQGAAAVVTEKRDVRCNVPVAVVQDARKAMALISDRVFGSPQNSLVMTGITGTNGKTTTTYMIRSIFEAAGMGCGIIGTIRHFVGERAIESVNTTPESPDIHAYLAEMVDAGQNACAMEVSSHALALSRVYGIGFRAVAMLNITRDHLDFHGDFKNYLDTKGILFAGLSGDSTAVINRDDPHAGHFMNLSRDAGLLTFGEHPESHIRLVDMRLEITRSIVKLATTFGEMEFVLPLPGRFNVWNAMAAIGIARACGFPAEAIMRGLETAASVRGRYEVVDEGQDFAVIVDYAHTPDALERILGAAREVTPGRVISVFGCGGDRDRGKRPLMGAISERMADVSVITSDNPRTEAPDAIIADILEGVREKDACEVVPGRAAAIRRAIELARTGDTVVIAGKGHEDYQIVGAEKRRFDDAETARSILAGPGGA